MHTYFQGHEWARLLFVKTNRSLDEIDDLVVATEKLKLILGEEKSKEVEDNPFFYYQTNKFKIY